MLKFCLISWARMELFVKKLTIKTTFEWHIDGLIFVRQVKNAKEMKFILVIQVLFLANWNVENMIKIKHMQFLSKSVLSNAIKKKKISAKINVLHIAKTRSDRDFQKNLSESFRIFQNQNLSEKSGKKQKQENWLWKGHLIV